MNLEATQDNIVLRPIMAGNVTAGGVILPNQGAFEDGAVVISIGPNVDDIAVGDIVVRPDPPRITVNDDDTGEIFLICAEVDILAKMLPDELTLKGSDGSVISGEKSEGGVRGEGHFVHLGGNLVDSDHVPEDSNDSKPIETPEKAEEGKGQEEKAASTEKREVHPRRVPEDRVGHLLPVHPSERLSENNGD